MKLRCLGVLCLNMWRSSSVVLRLYWVSCEFFQRVGGSCFGTFDAWGGKAARGRCCRFEEQHPLVLLCTWDPLRFAKETWGTKRTKKDQIEENWDEIAEKRKNWNTTRTSDRSILGVPLKILFLLKGLVEAFLECIYATEKQIPGWRCIMWYSKIVPHMSPNRFIVDTWSGYLWTCEMRASSSRPCTSGNSSALFLVLADAAWTYVQDTLADSEGCG